MSEDPPIVMSSWRVYEIFSKHYQGRTRHLIGFNEADHKGHVSSKIISYDPLTKIVVTDSGQRYQLACSSRHKYNLAVVYAWADWSENIDACDVVDVSSEYLS